MGVSPDLDLASEVHRLRERVDSLERQLQAHEPILPMYTLAQACALLPTTPLSLQHLLKRFRSTLDAAMYRIDARSRRYRMLSHRDLLTLRAHLIRGARRRSRRHALQEIAA